MKKYAKWFATFAVLVGAFFVLPAHAYATSNTSCVTVPDPYSGSSDQMKRFFSVSFSRTGDQGTATVKRVGSTPLCADQPMVFQSFNMGPNWNGQANSWESFTSSLPQTMAYSTHFVFGKSDMSKTITVKTPEVCKGTQLDVYVGDKDYTKIITQHEDEIRGIDGMIFQPNGTCEAPKKVTVCDASTGNITEVSEADKDKYQPADSDACKVKVCDTTSNTVKLVPKADKNKAGYEAETSAKCVRMNVCVKDSGDATMKPIYKNEYDSTKQSTKAEDCKKVEGAATTTTTPETPAAIPSTGPEALIGSITGAGALSYGGYTYWASRRALRRSVRGN